MTAFAFGIDPSLTATGVAMLSDDTDRQLSTITTKPDQPLARRLDIIASGITKALSGAGNSDSLVVIERPFDGGKGPSSVKLGMALGAVLLALTEVGLPYLTAVLVAPKVRAKYATGTGNAGKEEVQASAIRRLGYPGHNNNEADALWLAYIAAEVMHIKGLLAEPVGGWPRLPVIHYDVLINVNEWESVL